MKTTLWNIKILPFWDTFEATQLISQLKYGRIDKVDCINLNKFCYENGSELDAELSTTNLVQLKLFQNTSIYLNPISRWSRGVWKKSVHQLTGHMTWPEQRTLSVMSPGIAALPGGVLGPESGSVRGGGPLDITTKRKKVIYLTFRFVFHYLDYIFHWNY